MNFVARLVLLGFVPGALLAFAMLRARTAAALVLVAGSLLLPILTLPVPGPLDLGKPEAISFALLFGVLMFDPGRIAAFRPKALDLIVLAWLVVGSASSLANQLGGYDALQVFLNRFVKWGIPYCIGAMYFGSRDGLRAALWALFLSAVAYVPFALFEVRMSPELHEIVYGASQHGFAQTMRGGGYRPMVFMSHGLELSLWMAAAMVAGFTLWRSSPRSPLPVPLAPLVALVGITLVLCKSAGAILLGLLGVLACTPSLRRWLCSAMLIAVPVYLGLRVFGSGALEKVVLDLAHLISRDRSGSLDFRFDNEVLLLGKLWQNPFVGAGGWNFGILHDAETGDPIPITTDSFWIYAAATNGFVGLLAAVGLLWAPAVRGLGGLLRSSAFREPERLGACIVLAMLVLDCMANYFVPPLYLAIAGGLSRVPLGVAPGSAPSGTSAPRAAERPAQPAAWLQPRHVAPQGDGGGDAPRS
ncbi:MAG: hypothetical protein WAT39_18180 [Planctomycetota bacterium]